MSQVLKRDLYRWCKIPVQQLIGHPELRVRFRMVQDSTEMGRLMAQELFDVIEARARQNTPTRAIIPCGPKCWYKPFTDLVNSKNISLGNLFVFHMDECLDWQGRPLPARHPYNFRSFMEEHFYGGIKASLAVPERQRFWLSPSTAEQVGPLSARIRSTLPSAAGARMVMWRTTRPAVILTAPSRWRS